MKLTISLFLVAGHLGLVLSLQIAEAIGIFFSHNILLIQIVGKNNRLNFPFFLIFLAYFVGKEQ